MFVLLSVLPPELVLLPGLVVGPVGQALSMVLSRIQNDPIPPPMQLGVYEHYVDAQHAVDLLSDRGFPVEQISIVWNRLRRIEHVTGRRTTTKAAAEGGVAGAWIGAIIGVLLIVFVEVDPGWTELNIALFYAAAGAVVGAVTLGIGHLARRGTRDFSALDQLDAESFEVWVQPQSLEKAQQILASEQRIEEAVRS